MLKILADALSVIMQPCYDLCGNWWIAILLFTIIIKIVLMPMALWCQWNSIVMVKLMPDLNRIKIKYFGDRETIGDEQNKLYKTKHYHPLLSLVPLAVQIIILFGLVEVIHSITDNGAPGTEFLGMVPITNGGTSWIMPLLAGLSAVIMGFAQNRINPLQREQSKAEKNMTNGLSIALSLFLGVFVAAGMAFYWICSNLTSIVVQVICNICIKPKKHVDYNDLYASKKDLDTLNALGDKKKWYKRDPQSKREKADYKRFMDIIGKHIVFYSEGSGFYKYFRDAIEYLLGNSDVIIHYITNDPNDQIFEIAKTKPRIFPYYISEKRAITLMMKMDADIVVTTLEDIETYYIKRSYVRKDIEYVFMFHHMTSTHLVSTKTAYMHYNTLLCVGPHQVKELERAEEIYKQEIPFAKKLVKCGYGLLDSMIANYTSAPHATNERPVVLIAPSWQEDCILDSCFEKLVDPLLGCGYKIIVRPHPEYTKRYRPRWEALQTKYHNIDESELYFEQDFSSSDSIYESDILITDWSSVACDFSFTTLKPTLFIDTKMKEGNKSWRDLGIEPIDISLRNQIGASINPENVADAKNLISDMISNKNTWTTRIENVRAKTIFNIGNGGAAAGEYLLRRLLEIQNEKDASNISKATEQRNDKDKHSNSTRPIGKHARI